jgi:hypothetical protein
MTDIESVMIASFLIGMANGLYLGWAMWRKPHLTQNDNNEQKTKRT